MTDNVTEIPPLLLKQFPQLKQISAAVDAFRSGQVGQVMCPQCQSAINVTEDRSAGVLLVNCACGHCFHRLSWQNFSST